MQIFLVLLLLVAVFLSYYKNRDIFSPVKWYYLSLIYFFKNIFLNDYPLEIYFIYVLFIFVGILFTNYENKLKFIKYNIAPRKILLSQNNIFKFLILFSLIPLFAQLYFIQKYGGINGYINGLSLRVVEWKGKGYITALIGVFPIINMIFLILILKFKVKKKWKLAYFIHLIITILLGLLSGSRSAALYGIINYFIVYNYFIKRVKFSKILPLLFVLLFLAASLSIIRNEIKADDGKLTFYNEENFQSNLSKSNEMESYGLIPLKGIINKEFENFQYGLTFLTVITNFVPRTIWPGKPDSAGVIITKHIDGYYYSDTSNYSTGIITESVMNFGYFFGYFIGFVILIFIGIKIIKFYNLYIINTEKNYNFKNTIIDTYLLIAFQKIIGGILFGEFTNIFFNLIKDLLLLYFIIWLMKLFKIKILVK